MLYKPNYCCNCGEKTERAHWSLLTSRRFCEICEIEFKGQEMLPKIGAVLMLLLGVFGVGSYLMAGKKTAEFKPGKLADIPTAGQNAPENRSNPAGNSKKIPVSAVNSAEPAQPAAGFLVLPSAEELPSAPVNTSPNGPAKASEIQGASEPAYFCGAATKKGKPCTRRVKGGGRCWQHKGQPAILPPEKLRIS